MKILILTLFLLSFVWGMENHNFVPKNIKDGKFMDIQILDSKIIKIKSIDGEGFYGISGLSYDKNRNVIYAMSDRGRLFSTRVVVKDEKIIDFIPISGHRLKDENGKKFLKPRSDSEGMAIVDDGDKKALLVSFERYPKVIKFDVLGHGKYAKNINLTLPKVLKNIKNYQGKNGALEGLAYHPKFGILTTPEYPLKGQKSGYHGIYSSQGELCKFKNDFFDNAVTELELMGDGNLLTLQRALDLKNFSFNITLKKIYLNNIKNGICKVKNLAVFKTDDGWRLDNFEGLTHYRDNIYFMISDNNGNFFQKTILTMFRVFDPKQEKTQALNQK